MYQLLETDSWVDYRQFAKLIDCLPQLVRDDRRIEDIRKSGWRRFPSTPRATGLVAAARFAREFVALHRRGAACCAPSWQHASARGFVTACRWAEQSLGQVTAEDATCARYIFSASKLKRTTVRTKKLPAAAVTSSIRVQHIVIKYCENAEEASSQRRGNSCPKTVCSASVSRR